MPIKYCKKICYHLWWITTVLSLLYSLELYPTSYVSFTIYVWNIILYKKNRENTANIYVSISFPTFNFCYHLWEKENSQHLLWANTDITDIFIHKYDQEWFPIFLLEFIWFTISSLNLIFLKDISKTQF